MRVTFEVTMDDELEKVLEAQIDAVEQFLDDWADAVLFEAKRLLREGRIPGSTDPYGGGAFDLGNLARSGVVIKTSEEEREVLFDTIRLTGFNYAPMIEFGASPFHPPVKPLQDWARRNGLSNWKSAGWAIAKKINKFGLPPRPFLRTASFTVEKRLQEIWDNVITRIQDV